MLLPESVTATFEQSGLSAGIDSTMLSTRLAIWCPVCRPTKFRTPVTNLCNGKNNKIRANNVQIKFWPEKIGANNVQITCKLNFGMRKKG
jgi:hypothetical protein